MAKAASFSSDFSSVTLWSVSVLMRPSFTGVFFLMIGFDGKTNSLLSTPHLYLSTKMTKTNRIKHDFVALETMSASRSSCHLQENVEIVVLRVVFGRSLRD